MWCRHGCAACRLAQGQGAGEGEWRRNVQNNFRIVFPWCIYIGTCSLLAAWRRETRGGGQGAGEGEWGPSAKGPHVGMCKVGATWGHIYPSCSGPSSAHAQAHERAMSSTTTRCDVCGTVVSPWRGWKWVQQGRFFVWPMQTAGKNWWYKCCWNCWHDVRNTTLSPKLKGTSTVSLGSTTWAGSSFFPHHYM